MRPSWRSLARRAVARALALSGSEPGLRILTYHRVNADHPRDRLSVHPEAFALQMDALRGSGRPVMALPHAVRLLRRGTALPEGAVALTFDDGYRDNFTAAAPVLERFGFPATFFIATGYIGSSNTLPRYHGCCASDGMLDWQEVRDLVSRGHAVGGHSRTHREMTGLTPAEAQREAVGCAEDVQAEVGVRPRLFCYPRGSETAQVRRLVGGAGFEAACTVRPGANAPGVDLLGLRRTEVSGDDSLGDFEAKLSGGFDAWHRLVQRVKGAKAAS